MNSQRLQIPMVILASAISALQAAAFEPVQAVCTISTSEHHTGMFRVRVERAARVANASIAGLRISTRSRSIG